jgi:hypothetical protein
MHPKDDETLNDLAGALTPGVHPASVVLPFHSASNE